MSTHQFSKKSKQDDIYLEGGGTFFQNLVSGAVTTFTYHGAPIIPYGNNRHAKGPGLYLGAGYKWALSPQWAWSLGGRLIYFDIEQKGHYLTLPWQVDYQYTITALIFNGVAQTHYRQGRNDYYAAFTAGLAHLEAEDYITTNTSSRYVPYTVAKHTENRFTIGAGVGWQYQLQRHTSLDVGIDYQRLGKATLGPAAPPLYGNIEQMLTGAVVRVGMIHQF